MVEPQDISEVREIHRIDPAAVERYMDDHVEGFQGPVRIRQFVGGQSNPTYFLEDRNRRYVLRRKPPGELMPSAHAVDREYRVIKAMGDTKVPVPETFALCEDPAVLGTPFFVMAFVEGRVFRHPHIPDVSPADRRALFEDMARVLAALHQVDYKAVGLESFGRPGNYFERQIGRWSGIYRASETMRIEAMERLLEWLPANIPEDEASSIVHGDFRLGNMIVHQYEPRILAVLDWELSTLGHPLADLAYNCLVFHGDVESDIGFVGLDLEEMGYPEEVEHVAAYCRHTGRSGIPNWEFYLSFAMFRLACIAQGIMGRVRDGTASAPDAAARGARAPILAQKSWELIESLLK